MRLKMWHTRYWQTDTNTPILLNPVWHVHKKFLPSCTSEGESQTHCLWASFPDLVSYPDPPSTLQQERGFWWLWYIFIPPRNFGVTGWFGDYLSCTGLPYHKLLSFTHYGPTCSTPSNLLKPSKQLQRLSQYLHTNLKVSFLPVKTNSFNHTNIWSPQLR